MARGPGPVASSQSALLPSSSPVAFHHTPPYGSVQRHPHPPASPLGADYSNSNRYLFPFILLTQIVVYMEAGAVPALLNELASSFQMSFWMQGLMGGLGYIFLSAGCPAAAWAFRKWDVPFVLGCAIMLNALSTAVFAATPTGAEWVWLLVTARGLIGFSQAFPIIYFPLWCDEHAPAGRKTSWLSYVQGGVVVGILAGYAVATITFLIPSGSCGLIECWRVPFLLQVLFTLPLGVLAFAIPAEHCNIRSTEDEAMLNGCGGGDGADGAHSPLHSLLRRSSLDRSLHEGGTHVHESEEGAVGLVANVGSILGPHAVMPPCLPAHLEGEQPNSNPSPWPTPRHKDEAYWNAVDGDDGDVDSDAEDGDGFSGGSGGLGTLPHSYDASSASYQQQRSDSGGDVEDGEPDRSHPGGASLGLSLSPSPVRAAPVPQGFARVSSSPPSRTRTTRRGSAGALALHDDRDGPALVWHTTTTSEGLALLCRNSVYLCVVLSLSAGYFCIIGLSYWSTGYMVEVLGGNANTVRLGFIFCALTAPIGGVLAGGWAVDRSGGYSGLHQRTEALSWCCLFLLIGCVFAVPASLLSDLLLSSLSIWMLLFFGSATLPAATGVMLNSVHPSMRPFAAALATICFNVLGYFGGPIVAGLTMTATGSFRVGFQVILYAAAPCLLLMSVAWMSSRAQRKARRRALQRKAEHDAATRASNAALAAAAKGTQV